MKKLSVLLACILALTMLFSACGNNSQKPEDVNVGTQEPAKQEPDNTSADPSDYTVVMIVKQSDSWFDDMAAGIEQLKKDTGLNVSVQVPEKGDAASQIAIMENLIAQGVDAICVVPNDPEALIPTIEKAREAGIVVVTHEAPGIADKVDLDVEAFKNEEFGKLMGERLAQAMGGKGKFVGFVGGLTMETHMTWYKSAVEYIEENYPDMTCLTAEPYEDGNSVDGAYSKALEVLKAYPDIKGFFDCSAHGGGICQALKEKEKQAMLRLFRSHFPQCLPHTLKTVQCLTGWHGGLRMPDTRHAMPHTSWQADREYPTEQI
jgi:monosaccharide ABC transporter substrate-binding protein, CUT2 family (TC 3.A.1.2.-)